MNELINEKKPTLTSHFNSYPNAMKPNSNDTDIAKTTFTKTNPLR